MPLFHSALSSAAVAAAVDAVVYAVAVAVVVNALMLITSVALVSVAVSAVDEYYCCCR